VRGAGRESRSLKMSLNRRLADCGRNKQRRSSGGKERQLKLKSKESWSCKGNNKSLPDKKRLLDKKS